MTTKIVAGFLVATAGFAQTPAAQPGSEGGQAAGQRQYAPPLSTEKEAKRSFRMGQLEITITAVGKVADALVNSNLGKGTPGHHYVAVGIKERNASAHPNCTSPSFVLRVDRGYEYIRASQWGRLQPPRVYDLLPGKESGGWYAFAPHDGTRPATLIIWRSADSEGGCAGSQHRPVDQSGGERAEVSLEGLPPPPEQLLKENSGKRRRPVPDKP
jgi:hypothetical protein